MKHEIIMPALGMSQETGYIIAWKKEAGEPIKSDDILLEVETDKAAMEVEAGHNGYVAQILFAAGADVPVGDVIAIITSEKPQDEDFIVPKEKKEVEESKLEPPSIVEQQQTKINKKLATDGKPILASPKAKKYAQKHGLDLKKLHHLGTKEPFHFADIEIFKQHQISTSSILTTEPSFQASSVIKAKIPQKMFDNFALWLFEQNDGIEDAAPLLASFASAAYRKSQKLTFQDHVIIQVENINHYSQALCYYNADQKGLLKIHPQNEMLKPHLTIHDLRKSFLKDIHLTQNSPAILTLTTIEESNEYQLSFCFSDDFNHRHAIDFIYELTQIMALPVRHML